MNAPQILAVMEQAGFPQAVAVTMTAIALRESSGDPAAFNADAATGDRSYGLLQINMRDPDVAALIKGKIPEVASDEQALFDPAINAKAGFLLWGGHNRNLDIAWYIARDGPYKAKYEAHLPEAQRAALGI